MRFISPSSRSRSLPGGPPVIAPMKNSFQMAITLLLALRIVRGVTAQTTCTPLMQSLVQQAEPTGQYGSWDACCARTGNDCFLTQQYAPPGYEPCDTSHSARAGCNRTPQGTVCMIGTDGLISGSPCSASLIRMCAQTIVRDGVAASFDGFASLGVSPASILSGGILGTQLCCSSSSCQISSSCALPYNMSCVTDGTNIICVPLDQSNAQTYAVEIVQDGHGCAAPTSTMNSPSVTASGVPTASFGVSNKGSNAAIIGGVAGGVGIVVAVGVAAAITIWRNHHKLPLLPNKSDDDDRPSQQQGAVMFAPNATTATYHPDTRPTLHPNAPHAPTGPNHAFWMATGTGPPIRTLVPNSSSIQYPNPELSHPTLFSPAPPTAAHAGLVFAAAQSAAYATPQV
jgi:hypothetical protein